MLFNFFGLEWKKWSYTVKNFNKNINSKFNFVLLLFVLSSNKTHHVLKKFRKSNVMFYFIFAPVAKILTFLSQTFLVFNIKIELVLALGMNQLGKDHQRPTITLRLENIRKNSNFSYKTESVYWGQGRRVYIRHIFFNGTSGTLTNVPLWDTFVNNSPSSSWKNHFIKF